SNYALLQDCGRRLDPECQNSVEATSKASSTLFVFTSCLLATTCCCGHKQCRTSNRWLVSCFVLVAGDGRDTKTPSFRRSTLRLADDANADSFGIYARQQRRKVIRQCFDAVFRLATLDW